MCNNNISQGMSAKGESKGEGRKQEATNLLEKCEEQWLRQQVPEASEVRYTKSTRCIPCTLLWNCASNLYSESTHCKNEAGIEEAKTRWKTCDFNNTNSMGKNMLFYTSSYKINQL